MNKPLMVFFIIFCRASTGPFWEGSEKSLLRLVQQAERELKIFVYPFPKNIRRCTFPLRSSWKDMFRMESLLPRYYGNFFFTNDSSLADIFFVAHEWICIRVGNEPHRRSPNRFQFSGDNVAKDHVLPIWKNVIENYPYFNKSFGYDHVTTFVLDNGPFCGGGHIQPTSSLYAAEVMKYLENVSIIGNNGFKGKNIWEKHCEKPCEGRTRYDYCHREGQDIVIPQPHTFYSHNKSVHLVYNASKRVSDTFFKGQIRLGWDCSPHSRTSLEKLHQNNKNCYNYSNNIDDNKYIKAHILTEALPLASQSLWQEGAMEEAIFGFCPSGAACWSMRIYHAIASDTIPVILADPVIEPFERFLDWTAFSVKYMTERDGPRGLSMKTMMGDLHRLAEEARAAEREGSGRDGKSNICSSVVHRKVEAMRLVAPWLTFDGSLERSAYRLLTLELWCRTKKGLVHTACRRPVSYIANTAYL